MTVRGSRVWLLILAFVCVLQPAHLEASNWMRYAVQHGRTTVKAQVLNDLFSQRLAVDLRITASQLEQARLSRLWWVDTLEVDLGGGPDGGQAPYAHVSPLDKSGVKVTWLLGSEALPKVPIAIEQLRLLGKATFRQEEVDVLEGPPLAQAVFDIASPTGIQTCKVVAVGSSRVRFELVAKTGKAVEIPVPAESLVVFPTWSPDGKYLLSASFQELLIMEIATLRVQRHRRPAHYQINESRAAFSSDGQKVFWAWYGVEHNRHEIFELVAPFRKAKRYVEGSSPQPPNSPLPAEIADIETLFNWVSWEPAD
jgi:hypothetical protein